MYMCYFLTELSLFSHTVVGMSCLGGWLMGRPSFVTSQEIKIDSRHRSWRGDAHQRWSILFMLSYGSDWPLRRSLCSCCIDLYSLGIILQLTKSTETWWYLLLCIPSAIRSEEGTKIPQLGLAVETDLGDMRCNLTSRCMPPWAKGTVSRRYIWCLYALDSRHYSAPSSFYFASLLFSSTTSELPFQLTYPVSQPELLQDEVFISTPIGKWEKGSYVCML